MWDFQYNFGVLSSLVVYRARLLDRQHLLLKLGAPTSGPAAAAELSPNRVHFFALYDVVGTCFKGFWRGADGKLLAAVMAQPAQLLAASQDMNPCDRCCAAALYPPGFAIGLAEEEQPGQGQQPGQQQQQGQHRSRRGSRLEGSSRAAADAGQQQQGQRESGRSTATDPSAGGRGALQPAAGGGGTAAAAADAAAAGPGLLGTGDATAAAAGTVVSSGSSSSSSSSSRAAKERLKLLRQVVLLVLPGLQSLSGSPHLDPRLFSYSKHISPIIGLRNSPSEPLQFRHARRYAAASGSSAVAAGREASQRPAAAAAAAAAAAGTGAGGEDESASAGQQQRVLFQLEPAQPPSVVWGIEQVPRRQLHLFHPTDPFVLTVVQTIAQPAVMSICYRA
ncbi:hypothetical protein COO60DRAFT_956331 [Scenedesmus sp. NREL 46B-D3]|nr:hypothetical protein COO60DRAFT_956331 [Scenedesmus sp. NREL 46B-D3]